MSVCAAYAAVLTIGSWYRQLHGLDMLPWQHWICVCDECVQKTLA